MRLGGEEPNFLQEKENVLDKIFRTLRQNREQEGVENQKE